MKTLKKMHDALILLLGVSTGTSCTVVPKGMHVRTEIHRTKLHSIHSILFLLYFIL